MFSILFATYPFPQLQLWALLLLVLTLTLPVVPRRILRATSVAVGIAAFLFIMSACDWADWWFCF